MSDQLALDQTGTPTPPDLKLTRRQRFALELLAHLPSSSEALGAALHEYRQGEGGNGHPAIRTCRFCQPEGAHMGARLRELGLVKFSRKRGVWYVLEGEQPRGARGGQTDEIPF